MNDRKINLTNKNIRDFMPGDTLYIRKMERGYLVDYLVRFISFSRGVVRGEIIETEDGKPGDVCGGEMITARLHKCCLWGNDELQPWRKRCHWFGKSGVVETYEKEEI